MNKGDKVRFLNSVGGGIITRIEGRTAYVEDEDGFEIPTPFDELVVVNTEASPSKSDNKSSHSTPSQRQDVLNSASQQPDRLQVSEVGAQTNFDPHFILAFIKSDGGNSGNLDLYAVNDSNLHVFFTLGQLSENGSQIMPLHNEILKPHCKVFIDHYNPQRIDNRIWRCQLILYSPSVTHSAYPPSQRDIRIKSVRFFKENSFVTNEYFDAKAIIYDVISDELEQQIEKLTEHDMHNILSQKENSESKKVSQSQRKGDQLIEIDLHLNQIIDSNAGMTNGEMVQTQLARFEHIMQEHACHKGQKIVFIHGVGNGRLKSEIIKLLKYKYKTAQYQDASFREYGYGATLVTIR